MAVVSDFSGPKRGADRAVLLAHGAGADRNAAALVAVAEALAAAGVPSLRFDFPYRTAGRNAPDRPAVLDASVRVAAADLARRTKLPAERLVLGGRSMGGRYCSQAVAAADDPLPALGLLLLGYPLHGAGKSDQPRLEHFSRISVPVLFISGTRDSLAARDALEPAAKAIKGAVRFHWIDDADHGYRVPKRTGRTQTDVLTEVATASVDWVLTL